MEDLHPYITAWMAEEGRSERDAVESGGSPDRLIGSVEKTQAFANSGLRMAFAELYTVSASITVSRVATYRSQVQEQRDGKADSEG